jgi:hypothetical protein
LEDGSRGVSEGGEEGCEEASEAVGRGGCWVGGFRVQEPLEDGNATIGVSYEVPPWKIDVRVPYCPIEATGTEPESLPDILKEEISFNLSFQSNLFNESDSPITCTPPSVK